MPNQREVSQQIFTEEEVERIKQMFDQPKQNQPGTQLIKEGLTKNEIVKRIEEISGKMDGLNEDSSPKQHLLYQGEIDAFKWVLKFWDTGYYLDDHKDLDSEPVKKLYERPTDTDSKPRSIYNPE